MSNSSSGVAKNTIQGLDAEDLILPGVSLAAFTEEELALKMSQVEDVVHQYRGVWWRRSQVGWYQPCFPLSPIDHRESWPPPLRAFAGYTHVATPGTTPNSGYRTVIRDGIVSYRFKDLPSLRRRNLRRALNSLSVCPIEDVNDLMNDGHEVYVSCHARIRWGRDKSKRAVFQNWVSRAYRQMGFALGAYIGTKLVGFMIPHRVGNTIIMSFIVTHSDYLIYRPNDALYHGLLCLARQSDGVTQVDFGPTSARESLNQFKLSFGTLHEFPAYTKLNPLLQMFGAEWMRVRYPWLVLKTLGEQ